MFLWNSRTPSVRVRPLRLSYGPDVPTSAVTASFLDNSVRTRLSQLGRYPYSRTSLVCFSSYWKLHPCGDKREEKKGKRKKGEKISVKYNRKDGYRGLSRVPSNRMTWTLSVEVFTLGRTRLRLGSGCWRTCRTCLLQRIGTCFESGTLDGTG